MPNPACDFYFAKPGPWQPAFVALRGLILSSGLDEALKWGHPCYARSGANIVLMHGFNAYCALLFFKGALMADPAGILVQQTENVQAARQVRFTDAAQIAASGNLITDYIQSAIAVEMSGQKVAYKSHDALIYPAEFQTLLDTDPSLRAAFDALTPGRQKGYHLFFSAAKQAKTRQARIAKALPRIHSGKGPDDP